MEQPKMIEPHTPIQRQVPDALGIPVAAAEYDVPTTKATGPEPELPAA